MPPSREGMSQQSPCPYLEGWPSHVQSKEVQQGEVPFLQSLERANRREKKAVYEHIEADRKKVEKKSHSISITIAGEIDTGCLGKNLWDCLVRTYVPRMLDMSVIDWNK